MYIKIRYFLVLLIVFSLSCTNVIRGSVVSNRIEQVKNVYPNGSRINVFVPVFTSDGGVINNGGCGALVAYTTLKIFHNPWYPMSNKYKKIKSTVSTKNTSDMKKLFKAAKKGDVVIFRMGKGRLSILNVQHEAIFLSKSNSGINIYEANFGPKNKVWYNHYWKYQNFKSWAMGATYVEVYRSKNYNSTNKNKAAKNLKKGKKIKLNGITYKVLNSTIGKGKIKVIKRDSTVKKIPTYIGLNYDYPYMPNKVNEYFSKSKKDVRDEQFFKVKK